MQRTTISAIFPFLMGIFAFSASLFGQDTIFLYGDTIRVGSLEWDMQKDWHAKGRLITENRDLYGDHVRILLTYHRNKMVEEIAFGYVNSEGDFVRHGPSRLYYNSGHLLGKRHYIQGKLEGEALDYYKDGKAKLIANYKAGLLHGEYTSFFPDASPDQNGHYVNGKLDGRYQSWYNTGQIKWIEHWENGLKTGIDSSFYESGKLENTTSFSNDLADGPARAYHRNGRIWSEWRFEEGKLMEIAFVQSKEGNPLEVGSFHEGNGWVNIYNDDGIATRRDLYKNGYLRRSKKLK